MKLTFCWIILLALAPLYPLPGATEDKSLVGLTAVEVLVEDLPMGAAKLGLTKEALQTDIELKLRLAGMRIIAPIGAEVLYVAVNVASDGRAANIAIELDQSARLDRDPTIWVPSASTWSKDIIVTNPTAQGIRNQIKDQVDVFLNAWLSVNPKK
jgi:hypothetical protein